MDNALFELPTATRSPTRDTSVDHSRRDRNDEDFRAMVRESDSTREQTDSEAAADRNRRDTEREPQRDTYGVDESVAQKSGDSDKQSVDDPQQRDDTPETRPDHDAGPQSREEVQTTVGADGDAPAGDGNPDPTVGANATDTIDASLAAAQAKPEPTVTPPANSGTAEAASGSSLSTDAAPTTGPTLPTQGPVSPEGVVPPAPTREAAAAAPSPTPDKSGLPKQMPPQSPPVDAGAKPPTGSETATNAQPSAAEATRNQQLGQANAAPTAQDGQTSVPAAAAAAAAASQSPSSMEVPTEPSETPAAAAERSMAETDNRQTPPVGDATNLTNLTSPATQTVSAAAAAAASAGANDRATANKQTTANSAQTKPGAIVTQATASNATATPEPVAPTTPQTSTAREMALAAAADQRTPSPTMRAGDAAPDLAVFRETLATVLPDATGTQATDSTRSAGRIVAAELGARPQLQHPSLTDQVSIRIREAFNAGDSQVRIQLQPKELGRIDVRMEISESGRMSALVVAERPDTLEMLVRDSRGLERALQQAGFETDSNSLSFDLQGQGEQAENQEQGGNGAPLESASSDASAADEITIDLAALTNGDVSTSGVDIRV